MRILLHSILLISILALSACGTATGLPTTVGLANTSGSNPTAAAPSSPPATLSASTQAPAQQFQPTSGDLALARKDIKHIVIIMQENRSFDEYFGTYPGAIGIPMKNGVPTVCSPDPQTGQCIKPYYSSNDINAGGPHGAAAASRDIAGGKMNGFVAAFRAAQKA